jgi:hypothetical protein
MEEAGTMVDVAEWPKWLNDNLTKLDALGADGVVSPTFVKEMRDTCIELHHAHAEMAQQNATHVRAIEELRDQLAAADRRAAHSIEERDAMRERAAKLVEDAIPTASRERQGHEASPWSTLIACASNIRALSPKPYTVDDSPEARTHVRERFGMGQFAIWCECGQLGVWWNEPATPGTPWVGTKEEARTKTIELRKVATLTPWTYQVKEVRVDTGGVRPVSPSEK